MAQAFAFARKVTARYPIPFVFMTYYNIVFRYGVERFVADMAAAGVRGAIVPDLPPEEAGAYLAAMEKHAAGAGVHLLALHQLGADEAAGQLLARASSTAWPARG